LTYNNSFYLFTVFKKLEKKTMPLSEGYGILKGKAIERQTERNDKNSPHYQILVEGNGDKYRVPVNVKSVKQPFDLLVHIDLNFEHSITSQLTQLKSGFTEIPLSERKAGNVALDYIRMNLATRDNMRPVRADLEGRENDINDFLDGIIIPILNDAQVDVYAFGEPFGPEAQKDKVFGFQPGRGIHNIHMNQGNREARFAKENGVYQDGGLLIHFLEENRWIAFFSAFQSQAFHTDDKTGNPIDNQGNAVVSEQDVTEDLPTVVSDIKIVAALVNPLGDDVGKETVTLLNTTASAIDLQGWVLADRLKNKLSLSGSIKAGEAHRITLSGQNIQLSNQGGIITLLNPKGLKVDGVSYTKDAVKQQGQTIVF
jgi:uncharacterized protein YukJ/translation initiation factor 1 (eIF-1/SUI1)